MAEGQENNTPAGEMPSTADGRKGTASRQTGRKRRRKWLLIAASLVIVLAVVVILAPSIASTGFVRWLLVGHINGMLNGRLEIADWSLSWRSGTEVRGLRIFQDGRQILELHKATTELSLWDLLWGNLGRLGRSSIEGLDFVLKRYADGSTNFQRLLKPRPDAEPFELPDLHGQLDVDFRGTIEQEGAELLMLDRSSVRIKMEGLNQPAEHQIKLAVRTGGGSAGRLQITGAVEAFENGQFAADRLAGETDIELEQLDLAAIWTLLRSGKANGELAGSATGRLSLLLVPGGRMQTSGRLLARDVLVAGPILQGDSFRTSQLVVDIPSATYSLADGSLRIGVSTRVQQPLTIQSDQGKVTLTADAAADSLRNLFRGSAPGSEGHATLTADLDAAKLASQLPKLLRLKKEIRPTSGQIRLAVDLRLAKDQVAFQQRLDITNLAAEDAAGQRIPAQSVHLQAGGVAVPAGGLLPQFRDLVVTVRSAFASIEGKGSSLGQVNISGQVDLSALREELSHFLDLGEAKLAGNAQFTLATEGDLLQAQGAARVQGAVQARNLQISKLLSEPIDAPRLEVKLTGQLLRGDTALVRSLRDVELALQAGNESQSAVDLLIRGQIDLPAASPAARSSTQGQAGTRFVAPAFEIVRCNVNAAEVQRQWGPVVRVLRNRGLALPQGSISIRGSGAYDGLALSIAGLNVMANDLRLERITPSGRSRPVLKQYSAGVELTGIVRPEAGGWTAALSRLAWSDTSRLLRLEKLGATDLTLHLPGNAPPWATGKLHIDTDIKGLDDALAAMTDQTRPARSRPGDLLNGRLSGTLELLRPEPRVTLVAGQLTISDLSVATYAEPIQKEQLTVALQARVPDDRSQMSAQQLDLRSSVMNLEASDAELRLTSGSPGGGLPSIWDLVSRAHLRIEIADLTRAIEIASAFVPPEPARRGRSASRDPVTTESPAMPGPSILASNIRASLRIERAAQGLMLNVEELTAERVLVQRGLARFGPRSVSLKAGALAIADTRDTAGTMLQQLRELRVTALSGSLGVAELTLAEPLYLRDPAGAMELGGAIHLSGPISAVTGLISVIRGQSTETATPYSGSYAITERLATQGSSIMATGQIELSDLVVGNPRRPQFSEKSARLSHELTLDRKAGDLAVKSLLLQMPSSGALEISASGLLRDYAGQRRFDDVRATLGYDAARLMQLVLPLLSSDYRQEFELMKISGTVRGREVRVSGAWPATRPSGPAGRRSEGSQFRQIRADAALALDRLEYRGMVAEQIELPLHLADGILQVLYADRPAARQYPPAIRLNGGRLDLGGLSLDLGGDYLRISWPRANHRAMEGVTVNRELVDAYLGWVSPLFTDAEDARGIIAVTINELSDLPLGERLMRPDRRHPGRGRITFSLTNLKLKNLFIRLLAPQLRLKLDPDGTLPGNIRNGWVQIESGQVASSIRLDLGGQVLGFDGTVRLSDRKIEQMVMMVPKAMIPVPEIRNNQLVRDPISVELKGYLGKVEFDIVQSALKSAALPGLDLLRDLEKGMESPKGPRRR